MKTVNKVKQNQQYSEPLKCDQNDPKTLFFLLDFKRQYLSKTITMMNFKPLFQGEVYFSCDFLFDCPPLLNSSGNDRVVSRLKVMSFTEQLKIEVSDNG